ncbi:MAG: GTPase, partial [Planctomycetota bacterium]
MEIGLVGLPSSGKTSLFTALTGHAVSGFSDKPNVGVAEIPDPRLDLIAQYVKTRKVVHATVQLVDIPGVPGGDSKKLNSFLSHVRQVDATCHVVRVAEYGGLGAPSPGSDINELDTELVLADLAVAEPARDKAARYARGGDADAKARLAVLDRIVPVLEEGRAI